MRIPPNSLREEPCISRKPNGSGLSPILVGAPQAHVTRTGFHGESLLNEMSVFELEGG